METEFVQVCGGICKQAFFWNRSATQSKKSKSWVDHMRNLPFKPRYFLGKTLDVLQSVTQEKTISYQQVSL